MNSTHLALTTAGSPLSAPVAPSFYDRFAWLYDFVIGSEIYHRWAWGSSPKVHDEFARTSLAEAKGRRVLDAGCGSLLFTARAYRELSRSLESLTLLDLSSSMLERGRRRMGERGRKVRFERGDLFALPFRDGEFDDVFHFGVLHCLDDAALVLSELARATAPFGTLSLSCITLGRNRGDRLLRRFHTAGHIAAPRSDEEVFELVQQAGYSIVETHRAGSFRLIRAEKEPS